MLHHDPEEAEGEVPAFPSLGAMLAAIEEALASGAFFVGEGERLDQDDARWLPMAARHSGGLPFWTEPLAALDNSVYVPALGSTPTVEISVPSLVRQGDWIDLEARRRNGAWTLVRRRDVAPGQRGIPVGPRPRKGTCKRTSGGLCSPREALSSTYPRPTVIPTRAASASTAPVSTRSAPTAPIRPTPRAPPPWSPSSRGMVTHRPRTMTARVENQAVGRPVGSLPPLNLSLGSFRSRTADHDPSSFDEECFPCRLHVTSSGSPGLAEPLEEVTRRWPLAHAATLSSGGLTVQWAFDAKGTAGREGPVHRRLRVCRRSFCTKPLMARHRTGIAGDSRPS